MPTTYTFIVNLFGRIAQVDQINFGAFLHVHILRAVCSRVDNFKNQIQHIAVVF